MTEEEISQQIAHHEQTKATFEHWLANAGDIPNNYPQAIEQEMRVLEELYRARAALQLEREEAEARAALEESEPVNL